MAQDPSVDGDAPANYMLDGSAQSIEEGDPIPVLYGRLKIPGRPISININNYDSFKTNGYIINSNGDISSNASITDEK